MKYLVAVADDFGFSSGANAGALDAYNNGIITEFSLMVNAPGSAEAFKNILEDDIRNVGVHLMLYDLNKDKKYIRNRDYDLFLDEHDKASLEQKVKDEFKKFEDKLGRPPTHISSHQFTHRHSKLFDVIGEYANKHNIHVRKVGDQRPNGAQADEAYRQRGCPTLFFPAVWGVSMSSQSF
jgi:chitin disaccharide deacetylase